MTEQFLSRYSKFAAWVSSQTLRPVDRNYEEWKVPPSSNSLYTGYITVPRKIHSNMEFENLADYLIQPSASEQEAHSKNYIHQCTTAKFENLINIDLQDRLNIVSIGADCLPKFLISKWGLSKTRVLGGSTMALDLALGGPDKVLSLIEGDFTGLIDDENLSFDNVGNCPVNRTADYIFNHEQGLGWCADGYAQLKERYARRITNFRKAMRNGNPTIYIFNCYASSTDATAELALKASRALADRTLGQSACLFVLSAADETHRVPDTANDGLCVRFVRNKIPMDSYTFYNPEHYATVEGLCFEMKIISEIRDLALKLTPQMIPVSLGHALRDQLT